MKNMLMITLLAVSLGMSAGAMAKPEKDQLPPGLQKKQQRGQALPPGWQKKLAVGDVMGPEIYDHGHVVYRDDGLVTVNIEGKIVKVIENTREIVEILDSM